MTVVLASGSPRRRELLTRLGVEFEVVPSNVEERDPSPGEDPALYALELAEWKAAEVAARREEAVVLSADTVVAIDGEILNKPLDAADAARMLGRLRGRQHTVVTSVVTRCAGDVHRESVAAVVTMREYSDVEIARYVATGEPIDKAGAYAVQGRGGELVKRVEGCYETVVGLPLCAVARGLARCGVSVRAGAWCRHEAQPERRDGESGAGGRTESTDFAQHF
ncbi:MAG TPA: Maf family protein [Chloroflexota bacterium]|nr:Maf family protein [Chloroflexota bacterium]